MKAVRFNRGLRREEESARPVEVRFGNCLPLTSKYPSIIYAAIAKRIGLVACFATGQWLVLLVGRSVVWQEQGPTTNSPTFIEDEVYPEPVEGQENGSG